MRNKKTLQTLKVCLLFLILISCDDKRTILIWTDHPELALYGEYYNTMQNRYKVSVRYMEFPAAQLNRANYPDIIIASWLKNSSTQTDFKSLNGVFGSKGLSRNIFYQKLLTDGRIDRNQYLLPVSYNIPALIFPKAKEQEISNQFTIDFNEIKQLSSDFNRESRGSFTQMGFSPLWNNDFLLTTASLFGVSFSEGGPLSWDDEALEKSMSFIYDWTNEINISGQMEEDFTFKYFYESPARLIQSGRILFSYIKSSELFLLDSGALSMLDFRWIMEQGLIPITEDTVYLGIPKWSKSQTAARSFIMWFFKVENQRLLLEYSRLNSINENIFGICGGFSALSPVTEQIYPLFYPELLGRMPPHEFFMQSNALPVRWAVIKDRAVLPYLYDRARNSNADEIYPLDRRMADWVKLNR